MVDEMARTGIGTKVFNKGPGMDFSVLPLMIDYLKRNSIDIVHAHMYTANLWGRMAGLLAGVPILVTTEHNPLYEPRPRSRYYPERILTPVTDRIIAVARTVKDSLVRFDNAPEDKITVIYNAIEAERFRIPIDVAEKKRSLGIDPGRPIVGNVARHFEVKGQRYLIEAVAQVRACVPDVVFLLVGDGPDRGELVRLADSLGVSESVVFAGMRADVDEILQVVDLFTLSSLGEGLCMAILEAMAAGKAVVATEVGGNPELVAHGQTGLTVPSKDPKALAEALIELLSDGERRLAMGRTAMEIIDRKFSMAECVARTEALYEELAESKGIR